MSADEIDMDCVHDDLIAELLQQEDNEQLVTMSQFDELIGGNNGGDNGEVATMVATFDGGDNGEDEASFLLAEDEYYEEVAMAALEEAVGIIRPKEEVKTEPTENVVVETEPTEKNVVVKTEPTENVVVVKTEPTAENVVVKTEPTAENVVVETAPTENVVETELPTENVVVTELPTANVVETEPTDNVVVEKARPPWRQKAPTQNEATPTPTIDPRLDWMAQKMQKPKDEPKYGAAWERLAVSKGC
jgi:hypothetical protein